MQSINHYKEKLLGIRDELEKQAKLFDQQCQKSMKDSIGELSSYDNHTADLGAETFERSKDIGLKNNIDIMLKKTYKALELIDKNEYGICDICKKAIDPDRLEVVPYTILCVDCKKKEEANDKSRRRPIEEEVISAFDQSYSKNSITHDREDIWQDIVDHGTSNSPQDGDLYEYDESSMAKESLGIVEETDKIIDEGENENINELGK